MSVTKNKQSGRWQCRFYVNKEQYTYTSKKHFPKGISEQDAMLIEAELRKAVSSKDQALKVQLVQDINAMLDQLDKIKNETKKEARQKLVNGVQVKLSNIRIRYI